MRPTYGLDDLAISHEAPTLRGGALPIRFSGMETPVPYFIAADHRHLEVVPDSAKRRVFDLCALDL